MLGDPDDDVVVVRLFGRLRDVVGARSVNVPFCVGDCARDIVARLVETHQPLADVVTAADAGRTFAVAVDRAYVAPDAPIRAGVEVALIPPVSGG